MTAFSQYLQQQVLGATLLGSVYTGAQTVYAALATSVSTDGTAFTEVAPSEYQRQVIQFGSIVPTGTKHQLSNSADIQFPESATPWGTVTHVGIYDSPTGGNQLYWAPLSNVRTIVTGVTFQFGESDLKVQID